MQETLKDRAREWMTEFLGAGKSDRTKTRQPVPDTSRRVSDGGGRDRAACWNAAGFSTRVFEPLPPQKALVAVLSKIRMCISTRRVSRLFGRSVGHEFSPAMILGHGVEAERSLKAFATSAGRRIRMCC